jgi:hypothetical protein
MGFEYSVIINQLVALILNIVAWLRSFASPKRSSSSIVSSGQSYSCIKIYGPGGLDSLVESSLNKDEYATVGYNVKDFPPIIIAENKLASLPHDLVLVDIGFFSINYADICIRWGLYESALRYVGWPIIPGFDFSGVVSKVGVNSKFKIGDRVFGFSLFGAYSSRILVPAEQIRSIPSNISMQCAAALPAVAATALHAVCIIYYCAYVSLLLLLYCLRVLFK